MKKFIIGVIAILLLCSCEPKTMQKVPMNDGATIYAREFVYKGHRYIEFGRIMEVYDNYTGYVHDPDCPCHKSE